jgi:signal transduction histidine kinase
MFFNSNSDFDDRVSIKAAELCEQITTEMGAELHDDLIQKLYSLSFYIEHIERSSSDPTEVLALITRMRSDFENITQSVRTISRHLNPIHKTETTFAANITHLCQTMDRPGNGHITCSSTGPEQPLSDLCYTYLYRIIQELIHNAFKHSAAWKVEILIAWSPTTVTIQVEDDGTGPVSIDTITSTLQNKRNTLHLRSQAIHATIKYSKGKKGLLAKVECPINASHASS